MELKQDLIKMEERLKNAMAVKSLVTGLNLQNPAQLAAFGAEAGIRMVREANHMIMPGSGYPQITAGMTQLIRAASAFDAADLDQKYTLLDKLKGKKEPDTAALSEKYQAAGVQIHRTMDVLSDELNRLQAENQLLQQQLEACVAAYGELLRYLLAAEQSVKHLRASLQRGVSPAEQAALDMLEARLNELYQIRETAMQRMLSAENRLNLNQVMTWMVGDRLCKAAYEFTDCLGQIIASWQNAAQHGRHTSTPKQGFASKTELAREKMLSAIQQVNTAIG